MSTTGRSTDALERFTLWAIRELGLTVSSHDGVYRVDVPEEERARAGGRDQFAFTFERTTSDGEVEHVAADGPLVAWLAGALRDAGPLVHTRPADDIRSVHELTERLFPAYTVDGGNVHLAGCTLEDRPLVRLTYGSGGDAPICHVYVGADGARLEGEEVNARGLDDVVPTEDPPPRLEPAEADRLLARARDVAGKENDVESLVAAVVWCKFALGKLRFSIGNASAELPFSGWAKTLAVPPLVDHESGRRSFRVAATDDGRVGVAEAIAACEVTGTRVLESELVTCSVTGQRVLAERTVTCPVTGEPVLDSEMVECPACRQQVSRAALERGGCAACRNPQPVTRDDPRMDRLLAEYPGLDRWRRWRLSETANVYIATAAALVRRLMVVVDKQTFEVRHLATRVRFVPTWSAVADLERDELLGENPV